MQRSTGAVFRALLTGCSLLLFWTPESIAQKRPIPSDPPNQFAVGRYTFFDFGPPFNFYELFLVSPIAGGSSVTRITITPPGDMCISPAKIEVEFKTIEEAPKELLGNVDPCKIPEKELNRELKRCKNCLSFSGSNVAMQVQCGTKSRLIRSDILDRDMFDKNAKTPSHTSWTIALLQKMDSAVGPGVIDRQRMFSIEETYEPLLRGADSEVLQEVSGGKYDSLFPGARNKPSAVYRASKILPPIPAVQLVSSEPFQPENVVLPVYPSLAKLARVEGVLSFSFVIDAGARPADVVFESGNPLLRAGVAEAVGQWKFPNASAGQRIESKIEFLHNCPIQQPILTP